jgi:hypothetical protein
VCSAGLAYLVCPDFWIPFLLNIFPSKGVLDGKRIILGAGYLKTRNKEVLIYGKRVGRELKENKTEKIMTTIMYSSDMKNNGL